MAAQAEHRSRGAFPTGDPRPHRRNAEPGRQFFVMGDEHQGGAEPFDQVDEQLHDDPGIHRVERRRRFVGQDDRRPMGQCPRDGDPLALADRQARRHRGKLLGDAQPLRQFRNETGVGRAQHLLGQGDVLPHRQERQEPARLDDVAEAPGAQPAEPVLLAGPPQRLDVDRRPAVRVGKQKRIGLVRLQCHRQQIDQRALAAAAGADERQRLARPDVDRIDDQFERPVGPAAALDDAAQLHHPIGVAQGSASSGTGKTVSPSGDPSYSETHRSTLSCRAS